LFHFIRIILNTWRRSDRN